MALKWPGLKMLNALDWFLKIRMLLCVVNVEEWILSFFGGPENFSDFRGFAPMHHLNDFSHI